MAVPITLLEEIQERVAAFREANRDLEVDEKQLRSDLLLCFDKYGQLGDIVRKENLDESHSGSRWQTGTHTAALNPYDKNSCC